MNLNFVDLMLVVLFFQLISISPYFFIDKKGNRKFLGLFLLAKAFCISNFISFRLSEYALEYFPHLFYFGSSFTILWGPLLYFYVKSITQSNFKLTKKDIVHFIPFLIHFIYLSAVFHLHSADYKREMISAGSVFPGISNLIVYVSVEVLIGIYTILSIYLIKKFTGELKNNFSSENKANANWLWFIVLGFFTKWFSDFSYFIFAISGIGGTEYILSFSKIVMFLFLNYLIFRGFKQSQIFDGLITENKKSNLSENLLTKYRDQLVNFMDSEKPFLDPEISLRDLSVKSSIPQRSLSEVINNSFGKNFYDFINFYRIKESEKLLADPDNSRTVLEVIYESGFKSKSSFHKAFNKHTGMTPTQFREAQKN